MTSQIYFQELFLLVIELIAVGSKGGSFGSTSTLSCFANRTLAEEVSLVFAQRNGQCPPGGVRQVYAEDKEHAAAQKLSDVVIFQTKMH